MTSSSKSSGKIRLMVRLAVLIAIIIILTYIPNIGYITIGPIAFTIIQIPVIIGAIILGPATGAFLGLVFGLTSFFKALEGIEPVAAAIINYNIFLYAGIAIIPRVLMGWLTGLLYSLLKKIDKTKIVGYAVTGFVGSFLNTIFYLGALYLFVKDIIATVYAIDIGTVGGVVLGVATSNGIIEAVASMIIVTAIAKAMDVAFKKNALNP